MPKKKSENPKYNIDSTLPCPNCGEEIHVGTGGERNLGIHRTSKACKTESNHKAHPQWKVKSHTDQSLRSFFRPRAAVNKPTVVEPSRVHAPIFGAESQVPLDDASGANHLDVPDMLQPCSEALRWLDKLMTAMERIGPDVPLASAESPLSSFAGDPKLYVGPEAEDWEIFLGPMIKTAFGWGVEENEAAVKGMMQRGAYGLDGFHAYMKYFVVHRGLKSPLFESKVKVLIELLEKIYPCARSSAPPIPTVEVIDVDEWGDDIVKQVPTLPAPRLHCGGNHILFPLGKNHHTSYPFGLHNDPKIPWNYHSINDEFYLQSKSCRKPLVELGEVCSACREVTKTKHYENILQRIEQGVHENAPLSYHGVGGLSTIIRQKAGQVKALRLTKLNNTQKLLGHAAALEDHKQWIMAVASGKVDRVASLVQAGLAHHTGVRGLIREYERAAEKLYKPKGYTEDDIMRSIVMLQLGGARVADFAHRSLSLPSLTTVRRNTVIRPLIVLPSTPLLSEIEKNIETCYDAASHLLKTKNLPVPTPSDSPTKIVHLVLMLDELAVEKRARWDDTNDKFQGICREHSSEISLTFSTEMELDMLCDALKSGKVHLACEATVAAIGLLSENPHEYCARPILFSGTCKREKAPEHARLMRTILQALKNKSTHHSKIHRTVCIASDGESKRGDALVLLTMHSSLHPTSSIFEHLSCLKLMNLLVGEDNITADKDFKHVFKRQRNLMMRNKGIMIQGLCITPAILRIHLQSNGVSAARLCSLLNPNDKQDVVLGYSLLSEIWSLPAASSESSPEFVRAREALHTYGHLARHLIMPYISVNLDLSEQLIQLSTAAHIALYLYSDNAARTKFMPIQSYVDIMIMVKNVYFCVAKTKVDNPGGKFYLVLLGSDRLEKHFGFVRTSKGNDSNVDLIQLGNRSSGLTEVAVILAMHPEWDRGTQRLWSPVISETGEVMTKVDHISPASWRGNLKVLRVNLQTCWILGCERAVGIIPEACAALDRLDKLPGHDILSPLGTLLVNQRDLDDEYDCSELLANYPPELTSSVDNEESLCTGSYTHPGDMEDAMADEAPRNMISSEILINGKMTTKAKALRHKMMYMTDRASTDRLKRVQEVSCFNTCADDTGESSATIVSSGGPLGAASLRIGNPVASLVQCEGKIFLAIAQINRISFASQNSLESIALHLLVDSSAKVDYQILRLLPATIDDNPEGKHDWCWSLQMDGVCENIPGRLIHPVNPTISIKVPGKPTYLFESSFLVTLCASLHQELLPSEYCCIPDVKRSEYFPYRIQGKACFVCEHDETSAASRGEHSVDPDCLICGPRIRLDHSNAQRVLEHMGAHILYDLTLSRTQELCGLCLRPSPICIIKLKKGCGATSSPSIDVKTSTCLNLLKFSYAPASRSTEKSPCSNVPIICPLCSPQDPAVWKYNLTLHFREKHKLGSQHFPLDVNLLEDEKEGMRKKWDNRFVVRKPRRSTQPKQTAMMISQAHSSRLALRAVVEDESHSSAEEAPPGEDSDNDKDNISASSEESGRDIDRDSGSNSLSDSEPPQDSQSETFENQAITSSPRVERNTELEEPLSPFDKISSPLPTANCDDLEECEPPFPPLFNAPGADTAGNPPSPAPEVGDSRARRVRKTRPLNLDSCICGNTVSAAEIETGSSVMACRVLGCETVWFHQACMGHNFAPKNWACPSCKASGKTKRRRT